MKSFKSIGVCLIVCFAAVSFLALPALADSGWHDEHGQGKQGGPPIQSVGPSYYGQPMMLDERPWHDDPPRNGHPEYEASPAVGPSAWWQQPALDGHTWGEDPPKGKDDQTP